MKKNLICICLCLAVFNTIQSQELPEIIPHHPEASALGKYGDIPVGYFTGVPNISIPLLTLQGRGLDIPVSLNYHASGIRVSEMASRVGLGWSLQAGGAVIRSMRGIPDDTPDVGYLYTDYTVQSLLDNAADESYVVGMLHDASEGLLDLESDSYSYNIMGYSGKFHFNQSGEIITHPNDDVKIIAVTIAGRIKGWQITTKEGIVFYLGLSKDQSREAIDTANPTSTKANIAGGYSIPTPGPYTENYNSSWQLMEIEMPSGDRFSFEYDSSNIEFWNLVNQKKYFGLTQPGNCLQNDISTSFSINNDVSHRLTKINGSNGYIILNYDLPRLDLLNDFALTAVQLYNNHNQLVDHYELQYDYFTSTEHLSSNTFGNLDQRRKRLYLEHVTQHGTDNNNRRHSFSYNTQYTLPDRFSFAQDAWGYYNGQDNIFFYPEIDYPFSPIGGNTPIYLNVPGGNRKVYPEYAAACMLNKITYPTGGHTEFIFEPNSIANQSVRFFATSTLQEHEVFSYSTAVMEGNEITHIIPIPENYVGGLRWQVHFDDNCENPNAFDCPRAELFLGDATEPIAVSSGNNENGHFYLPDGTDTVTLKLYNYSGELESPERHIQADIVGLSFDQGNVLTGGFRIKNILNKDRDESIVSQKWYEYGSFDTPETSSGAALFPPTFVVFGKTLCLPEQGLEGGSAVGNELSATSIFPLTNGSSYTAGYSNVTEYIDEAGTLGKTEYAFLFAYDGEGVSSNIIDGADNYLRPPLHDFSYRRGALLGKKVYKNKEGIYQIIEEEENSYIGTEHYNISSKNIISERISTVYPYMPYTNYSGPFYKLQTIQKTYGEDETMLSQTTNYSYDPYPGRNFPIETRTTTSLGETYTTKMYYPEEVDMLVGLTSDQIAAIETLEAQHRIAKPIQTERYRIDDVDDEALLSTQRTLYKDWGDGLILPEILQTSSGNELLEDRIHYRRYDDFGNLLEVSKEGDSPISYIWGYGHTQPIAKLEGVSYADIDPTIISNLQVLSDSDNDEPSENALREALHSLRSAYPNATITTFTYDPLVGVTSITDPKGNTTFYSYDAFNRLEQIKDRDRDTLETLDYNYIPENE